MEVFSYAHALGYGNSVSNGFWRQKLSLSFSLLVRSVDLSHFGLSRFVVELHVLSSVSFLRRRTFGRLYCLTVKTL